MRWACRDTRYNQTAGEQSEQIQSTADTRQALNMRPVQESIKIMYFANGSEEPFVEVSFEERPNLEKGISRVHVQSLMLSRLFSSRSSLSSSRSAVRVSAALPTPSPRTCSQF